MINKNIKAAISDFNKIKIMGSFYCNERLL